MSYDDESELDNYFDRLFELIRRRLRRVYNEQFLEEDKPSWDVENKCFEPLVHLFDEGDTLVVTADLPMVKKEDIKLTAAEKSLTIEANLEKNVKFDKWGTVQRRIEFCRFRKVLNLPEPVKPEEAKAEFKNGFLIIKLPKKKTKFTVKIE